MMLRTLIPLLVAPLGACVHRPPLTGPPLDEPVVYGVAVAVASGNRLGSSLYRMQVEHERGDVWTVRTLHSEGTWEEGGVVLNFSSEEPRDTDPWPVVYQHAISAQPAQLHWSEGRPTGLVDEVSWRLAGLDALQAVERIPPEGLKSGEALLDPAGFLRDLQRNFPGAPPEGMWVRSERVAGVDATLRESCSLAVEQDLRTWTCEGTIESVTGAAAHLSDTRVHSTLIADALGLVSFETKWSGVLRPKAESPHGRQVAGHRLVQRQSAALTTP